MMRGPRHTWPDLLLLGRSRARAAAVRTAFLSHHEYEKHGGFMDRPKYILHLRDCEACRANVRKVADDPTRPDRDSALALLRDAGFVGAVN